MANTLSKTGITNNSTIEAWHVTQSVDAFTGINAYDVTISGSFTVTGPTNISGSTIISSLTSSMLGTASYALTASYFSGSISNAISSSYALTASFLSNAPLAVKGEYISSGSTVGLVGDLKIAAGYGSIPLGNTFVDLLFNDLNTKILGIDCFVSVGISSSYTTGSMGHFPRVDSLIAGTLRFSIQSANASSATPFFYTIIYK
jgi:hypothetical protein